MLPHFFKITFRNFQKNRLYASLNLLGLAIGFAASALIFLYLQHEISYERFHTQSDRIYRATYHFSNNQGFDVHWARIPVDYINELTHDVPEVQSLVRFQNQEQKYVRVGQEKYRPDHAYVVDSTVFEVFDFVLQAGDPQKALAQPNSLVLTRSLARAYFGTEKVLGRELFLVSDYDTEEKRFLVTGVMEDLPDNTHLPVEMLLSFSRPDERQGWAYVYLLLQEKASIEAVAAAMPDFVARYSDPASTNSVDFVFQALPDIHLHSDLAREIIPNGNALYPRLFGYVALFLLLIAMFNFINLSSALAIGRSKEIGMRRILGAEKRQLIRQALLESLLYNLIAAGLGMVLAFLALPYFERLIGMELAINLNQLYLGILLIAVLCGILSGLYPAFILTGFRALDILKQSKSFGFSPKRNAFPLKRIMIALQFCAAILLVASTLGAWSQLRYMQHKNLGINQEQVLAISAAPPSVKENFETFRNRIRSLSGVRQVAACMEVPSREIRDSGPVLVQGLTDDPTQAPMMDAQVISPGFVELMELELLAGEDHSDRSPFDIPVFSETLTPQEYLNNRPRNYLINEVAMHQLGWERPEEAIGQQINWAIGGFTLAYGPITGVVKNYHQETLKNTIDPIVMFFEPIWLGTFLVRIETQATPQTIAEIQTVWDELFPSYPMEYHFLDDLYERLYKNERIQLQLLFLFSGLTIFVAFMGLFALVAYSLNTRRKEIAIRKILGAQALNLIRMISQEYVWVLLLGALFAIPLSIYGLQSWRENFAYRVDISPLNFVLTLLLVVGLLFATIGIQVLRTAAANPADTLREE